MVQTAAREREARALEHRKAGASHRQIGQALGVSESRACHIVQRALKRLVREPAEELVELETTRLDALLTAMWPKAMQGSGWAVDRCLAIMDRRAKLLGLDQPAQVQADVLHHQAPAVVDVTVLRNELEARRAHRSR